MQRRPPVLDRQMCSNLIVVVGAVAAEGVAVVEWCSKCPLGTPDVVDTFDTKNQLELSL